MYKIKYNMIDDIEEAYLYWSNIDGWTKKEYSDTFTTEEKNIYNLPLNSIWEQV